MADALSYIQANYKPSTIIDIATLTGACVVALGMALAVSHNVPSSSPYVLPQANTQRGCSQTTTTWQIAWLRRVVNRLNGAGICLSSRSTSRSLTASRLTWSHAAGTDMEGTCVRSVTGDQQT